MAKKARAPPPTSPTPPRPSQVAFPPLSPKGGLECRVLLEDQIMLIDVRALASVEMLLYAFD